MIVNQPQSSKNFSKWLKSELNAILYERDVLLKFTKDHASSRTTNTELESLWYMHTNACLDVYSWTITHSEILPPESRPLAGEALYYSIQNIASLQAFGVDPSQRLTTCLHYKLKNSDFIPKLHSPLDITIHRLRILQSYGAANVDAWDQYKTLDVRKVLIDSMSPSMFHRISGRSTFASNGFDAYTALSSPLNYYDETISDIARFQKTALEHQNYAQCLGMTDFVYEHRSSPVRWMLALERRRIARLRGTLYDEQDRRHPPSNMPLLSPKTREFWDSCPGKGFRKDYTEHLALIDLVAELLRCELDVEQTYLLRAQQLCASISPPSPEVFTGVEIRSQGLHAKVFAIMAAVRDTNFAIVETGLLTLFTDLVAMTSDEQLDYIRDEPELGIVVADIATALECMRTSVLLSTKLRNRLPKSGKGRALADSIREVAQEGSKRLMAATRERIAGLDAGFTPDEVLAEMAKHGEDFKTLGEDFKTLGERVLGIVGTGLAATVLRNLQAAAKSSLEGVLKIKVAA